MDGLGFKSNHIFVFYHRNLLQFNLLALEMAASHLQSLSTYLNAILGSIVGMHGSWLSFLPMRECEPWRQYRNWLLEGKTNGQVQ